MEIKLREVLKRELKNRNESINSVAKNCSIPSSVLHGWLQGVLPSAKNLHLLKNLSDYFQIHISELLFNIRDEKSKNTILFTSEFVDGNRKYKLVIEKLEK